MRPINNCESGYVTSYDNYKIYYEKYTPENIKKMPILLIHGLSCNMTVWKEYIPIFLSWGHQIIAPDLRGHGKSDKKADISFEKAAKDLKLILKKEGIEGVIILANCFGVGVALNYCKLYGESVRKMVFITPTYVNPLKYKKVVNRFTKLFYNMLKTGLKYAKVDEIKYPYSDHTRDKKSKCLTLYLKNFRDNPVRTHLACFYQLITQDDSNILPNIDCPVLIIAAEKDVYTPLKISKDLKKMISHSKLKVIKDMDHAMMIRIPHRISRPIYEFVEQD